MENATKALMIAGAVLIAIMIIGLGMSIYQSATGIMNDTMGGLDELTISNFNNPLLEYEGDQRGSKVKQIISKIITTNASNVGINDDRIISFNGKTESADLTSERTALVSGATYTVVLTYDGNGLITTITSTLKEKK